MLYSFTSGTIIASLIHNSFSLFGYWLWKHCNNPPPPLVHDARKTVALLPTSVALIAHFWYYLLYFYRTLISCSEPLARTQGIAQKNILIWDHTIHTSAFQSAISVYFCIQNFQWLHRPFSHSIFPRFLCLYSNPLDHSQETDSSKHSKLLLAVICSVARVVLWQFVPFLFIINL